MKLIIISSLLFSLNVFAKDKNESRLPASVSQQTITCTVGDGKEASTLKTLSAVLKKSSEASINQEIGDYRIMAYYMPQVNKVTIGVIEKVSGTTASTLMGLDMQVGNLFASKNGQSVDLNCYVK